MTSRTNKKSVGKIKITDYEWAFHKVPDNEHQSCLLYELDREFMRCSENVIEQAWLQLSEEEKIFWGCPPPEAENKSIWSFATGESLSIKRLNKLRIDLEHSDALSMDKQPAIQQALLHINWRYSDNRILKDFKILLGILRPKLFKVSRGKLLDSSGRRRDVKRKLVDLAIWRTNLAHLTEDQSFKLIREMLLAFGLMVPRQDREESAYSNKHWPERVREAKRLFCAAAPIKNSST